MNLTFITTILIRGVNPYVLVSESQAQQLKPHWRQPMPVVIQVNGEPQEPWHINMMPVGDGDYYLYLHNDVRKASRTKVGDTVSVEVAFDTEYQAGPDVPPPWFNEALNNNRVALTHWNDLSPSRQKEVVRYLARLKSPEAQKRNLDLTLRALSGQEVQFIGRAWRNGS